MIRRKLLLSTAALLVGVGLASAQGMREGTGGGAVGGPAAGAAKPHMSQGAAAAERSGERAQAPSRSEGPAQRSEHAQSPSRSETTGQGSSNAQAPSRSEGMSQRSGGDNKAERRSSESQKQGESRQKSTQRGQSQPEKRSTTGQAPSNEPGRRGESQHQNKSTTGQAPSNTQPGQRGQNQKDQNRATTGQAPSGGASSNGQTSTQRNTQQPPTNQPSTAQQPSPQQPATQPQTQGQTNSPAQNQTQTGAATQGTSSSAIRSASGRVTLDAQRQTTIRETVFSRRDVPRVSSANFAVSVGIVVPSHIHAVPITRYRELVEVFPEYRSDEFFVVDDDIVIVDRSRKVVDVVPAGPRSRFSHAAPSGGASPAVALDLSVDEIREVQEVLIREGFLVGQPTGVLDVRTHDAIIAFQRQKGIQVTGSIDVQTVSSLGLSGRIQGTTGAATNSQGSAGAQPPGQNNMPSTNGQGQNLGNQGANQPNGQMPQQNRSTTGQAPSGGMQQQAPAQNPPMQNPPMQNQPMSGQGSAQPAAPAPQNQNRPSR